MTTRALNEPAEIPPHLNRWNWGAFLLNWIWGIGNSTFIALLCLIPLVNIVMIFVLGARGSRWAWRNRAWRDEEHFRRSQRAWAIAGVIVWAVMLAFIASLVVGVPRAMKNSEVYTMTMSAVRSDDRVTAALGDDIKDSFWISGSIDVQADGTGQASYSIPVHGAKGEGTAFSHATRTAGTWDIRLLVVQVEGGAPIVLVNKDNATIPGGSVGI